MSIVLDQVITGLHSAQNRVLFAFRNFLRRGSGEYVEPWEDKSTLFALERMSPVLHARHQELLARYPHLGNFTKRCTRQRYQEALTYLDYLDQLQTRFRILQNSPPSQLLRWLDVGAKNWAYVDGLYAFLTSCASSPLGFVLEGVELDGYRQYTDGHHRAEYAEAFVRSLPLQGDEQVQYIVGDVLNWPVDGQTDCYEVISCFLPFVFAEPCLAWGLPMETFHPERFFRHLLNLLTPGGVLLIVNQGQDEAEEQVRLLQTVENNTPKLSLTLHSLGSFAESFLPFEHPRHGLLCKKN